MNTIWIYDNTEKAKEIIAQMLQKEGDINLCLIKQGNMLRIVKEEDIKEMVPLEDKIIGLGDALCREKKGAVYKNILEAIEKPLFRHILEYTDGNQLKAARILGINRNTMRSKIKKLGINPDVYKR